MFLTIIESKDNSKKFAISTLEDPKKFVFRTLSYPSMFMMAAQFASNFILNFPLRNDVEYLESRRSTKELGEYLSKTNDYFILDFDDVRTETEREDIVQFLKPYKCVIFASRSYNDISNFNIKAIVACDNLNCREIKLAIKQINNDLASNGIRNIADLSAASAVQITAPSNQLRIFHCNETGAVVSKKDIKATTISKSIRKYKDEIRGVVEELFNEIGYFSSDNPSSDKRAYTHKATEKNGFIWYASSPFTLFHWNPSRNVTVFKEFNKRYKLKDFIVSQSMSDMLKPAYLHEVDKYLFYSKDLQVKDIQQSLYNWRDNGDVIGIKSPMGTGKSRIIGRTLKMFNHVLIVTPRVTLAKELASRFNLDMYNEELHFFKRSMVCQYDSLHKVDIRKFNCVIFDEFMTTLSHITNNCNMQLTPRNMARIYSLLTNRDVRVMLIDAFLQENVLDLFHDRKLLWCENTYRDDTKVLQWSTSEEWFKSLYYDDSRTVTVSCVSNSKIANIAAFLESKGYKVGVITAEVDNSKRRSILQLFESGEFNALVYSPAMSVGVNVLREVDKHYHFDMGRAINSIQSIQMIKRVRNAKSIEIFIGESKNIRTTSIDEIRQGIAQGESLNFLCQYSKFGDVRISPMGKMYSLILRNNNIIDLDFRESFKLFAAENFRFIQNVAGDGKEVISYSSIILKSDVKNDNVDEWDVKICNGVVDKYGDHLDLFKQYLTQKEVKYFNQYFRLRKSMENSTFMESMLQRSNLLGDFGWKKEVEKFKTLYHAKHINSTAIHKLSIMEAELPYYGIIRKKTLLMERYEFKENFVKLYDSLNL